LNPNKLFVRLMQEDDLKEAERIMRLSFGTFLGLPDPLTFMGNVDYVNSRYRTDPSAAWVAEVGDNVVGSSFATNWGSVGIIGPLTVHPDYWDKGIAGKLLEETMKVFDRWGTKHIGLFTFAQSSKHVHLYQKFGFWARYLTAVMSKQIGNAGISPKQSTFQSCYSKISLDEQTEVIEECRRLTNAVFDGLSLEREIISVEKQRLGDTILLRDRDKRLVGIAICHQGARTEAGSGKCYVKFGAVKPASNSMQLFDELVNACEEYARLQNASHLIAGVSMGRHNAYKRMIGQGFRTDMQGVAMHKANEQGYNLPEMYVIDDWR
jgi:GNAT superfamily N-acetyltransferase